MKTIKIGRSPDCDFIINDGYISTHHAMITVDESGEIFIEDLGSKNGTVVNGKKIDSKTKLTPASTVLLGNHSIDWKTIAATQKKPKPTIVFPDSVAERKLIGRNAMSQIRFSYDDISDKHAWLCRMKDGGIQLIDNNSTNGTYVNGIRISSPCVLKKGDSVMLSGKHPLNWESVYPPKIKVNLKGLAAIAASIVAIAAVLIILWGREKDWSRIYADHKHDVVLIYVKSAYAATVNGRPLSYYLNGVKDLDYCTVAEDGEISSGIATSSGTGFFISSDGKILTNRHVVGDIDEKENAEKVKQAIQFVLVQNELPKFAANVEVSYVLLSVGIVLNDTYIDSENDLIPVTVLKTSSDPELDVAMLQTKTKTMPNGATYVDLSKSVSSDKLKIGTKICSIGFPKSFTIGTTSVGLEANNQSGEITQERGRYEYGHNITIQHGASGSPVYDKKGRFAGIVVSGFLGISQGYNQAIHPTPILEFVNQSY